VLKQPADDHAQFEVSEPEETRTEAQSTGNPDDYQQMATLILHLMNLSNVSDDLVKSLIWVNQVSKFDSNLKNHNCNFHP